jgi:molybdopterin molybdotransferase
MISYSDALKIINNEAQILGTEVIDTCNIVGRILAETVKSPMAIQQFDNSAMDGYALNASNITNASLQKPVELICLGKIAAGEAAPHNMSQPNTCWEIMTGAIMPNDCDSVVPVENISQNNDIITFTQACEKNAHLRFKGEDFMMGDTVLVQGTLLTPEHILVLATLGIATVTVRNRVKIAVISTGKEVINDLSQPLETGQIYNSTGPYCMSALTQAGADVKFYGTLPDKQEEFAPLIHKIAADGVNLIVSTGAVSAGKHDFIKPALVEMGAEILFHKVFIRPGKPNLFAKLNNGMSYFGLPGNPVATVAGIRFFVRPLMRALLGLKPEQPIKAKLLNNTTTKSDFRFFLKAAISQAENGDVQATILKGQKSFMVNPFTKANAWAVVTENQTEVKAGDVIDVYPLTMQESIFKYEEL